MLSFLVCNTMNFNLRHLVPFNFTEQQKCFRKEPQLSWRTREIQANTTQSKVFFHFVAHWRYITIAVVLCVIILVSPDRVRLSLSDDPHTFHCNDYFVLGGIRTYLAVPWISSNSCPLDPLLVRSHQAEINIALAQQRDQGAG